MTLHNFIPREENWFDKGLNFFFLNVGRLRQSLVFERLLSEHKGGGRGCPSFPLWGDFYETGKQFFFFYRSKD